eukprot:1584132-Alexandrium_andersonii.AAC.1
MATDARRIFPRSAKHTLGWVRGRGHPNSIECGNYFGGGGPIDHADSEGISVATLLPSVEI